MRKGIGCGCGLFFGLLLLAISAGGAFWLRDSVRKVSGSSVEGVIVDLVETHDSDGDLVYRPVVEYEVDGTSYRIESSVSYGGLAIPDVGDRRTVYYDEEHPENGTFRGFWTLWFFPGLLFGVPLLIFIALVFSAAVSARKRREGPALASPAASQWGGSPQPTNSSVQPGAPTPPGPSSARPESPAQPRVAGGAVVVGDFMGAEPSQMDAEGRVRYRVRAQAEIDGVLHRFKGPWLDEDPTLDMMRSGNQVRIRIDPTDPSRYELLGPE